MRAPRLLPLLGLVLPLSLPPGSADGAEITRYERRLSVEPDGSGKSVTTLVVAGAPGESLEIPLGPGPRKSFRLSEAPEGLVLEQPKPNGTAGSTAMTVRVTLPSAPSASSAPAQPAAATRFAFSYDVPEVFLKVEDPSAGERLTIPRESRTFAWAFVNTQPVLIRDFSMVLTLPEGFRFHAIREQLPKPKKSEVEPRVRLGAADGRQNARLQLASLAQGDDASMKLEVLPSRRSPLWLAAGALLSLLYLVGFRDLVARPADSTKNP